MGSGDKPPKKGKKVRVAMRRNRAKPPRLGDWTRKAREIEGREIDTSPREMVTAKGDLSRRRTVIIPHEESGGELPRGIVVSMHGLYTQVDDGTRVIPCAVPRILRTRLIKERHPVTVGDWVRFKLEKSNDELAGPNGVIESVEPRHGQLQRQVDRRIQTVVANVDQAVIVSSADDPPPKPNLIDRYIVSALSGEISPVLCMNKIDLDPRGYAREIVERYVRLGYVAFCVSATTGQGIGALRQTLQGKSSVVAGQSGVGKSSLLNAVQPGLGLKVGEVTRDTQKGRHTTTSATLFRLNFGGFVVDTPGVRAFELVPADPRELEVYFAEFVPLVPECKFPDCTHTHESNCAVKAGVESGGIHPDRYESYVRLFEEGASNDKFTTR